jgi:hypothetical protein
MEVEFPLFKDLEEYGVMHFLTNPENCRCGKSIYQ